ncbi:ferrous iron transporter B [Oxalobacter vibrioformis]|uniref:Fe(2+) transporter FeoB n=1 Tax=Oxalobacter vibrioformis TaxID=933080 RepID=A0A9E9P3T8_9BURK|nr:ferrous iron transporter B [Oxalobacter vibrioformis]WAW11322.1 ferrous iron transporter B [Oxalobacter vibrioformis]
MSIALVGNPNSGKSALFNRLTGASQKVANYAGVTVERKEGYLVTSGTPFKVIDLPGTYSLSTLSPDEAITREVLEGSRQDDASIDMVVLVTDANNLRRNLQLVLEVKSLGYPAILVLNMMDIARKRGLDIDINRLSSELDMPVVETVAIRSEGLYELIARIEEEARYLPGKKAPSASRAEATSSRERISQILNNVIRTPSAADTLGDRIDAIVLHPVLGYLILAVILFGMFQAVYSWSELPMEWIESGVEYAGEIFGNLLPDGILKSLLIDGILAGVGSVIVFLPQILILFLFILFLEESGYLPRAAFLLDRIMRSVGLSGRAFIPLLSCFACAIPGIMATRTIQDPRNRLATIMIAPLMTCSARLPVYLLVIGAFIPNTRIGFFNLQGLVLFGLYMSGILSAMIIALIIKLFIGKNQYQPLMMELPAYHWPNLTNLLLGLWERAKLFITRAGTIILALMVLLWFLSSFPGAPDHATEPAIRYSFAGQLGHFLQYIFEPIGFNWQLSIALIPGMAAREASVAALGTVYALSATGDELSVALSSVIAATWGLPTALSLLAWYVFAPQCIPMIIVTRRETNSWKYAGLMTFYLFALAYLASFATYRITLFLTGG